MSLPRSILALTTALSLAAAATISPAAQASDCKSATMIASDLWSEFGKIATAAGCAVASSQGVDYSKCYSDVTKYTTLAGKMVTFFNGSHSSNWSTIGPRELEYSKNLTGTIVGPTERMFISSAPSDVDSVTFTIKKTDGKQENNIHLCAYDSKGNCTSLASYTFENGNDNVGKTWTKTVTGVKGKILGVHLAAAKVNANEFSYTLKAVKN